MSNKNDQLDQEQLQQQVEMLEGVARNYMTPEAISRYGNLKAGHPEKAIQLIAFIAQAVQAGQIKERLTDESLRALLIQMQPKKKEFKITRK